jgi:hypothetical protein
MSADMAIVEVHEMSLLAIQDGPKKIAHILTVILVFFSFLLYPTSCIGIVLLTFFCRYYSYVSDTHVCAGEFVLLFFRHEEHLAPRGSFRFGSTCESAGIVIMLWT